MEQLIKQLNEENNFKHLMELIFKTEESAGSCSSGGGGGAGDCGSCQTN